MPRHQAPVPRMEEAPEWTPDSPYCVVLFYKYVPLENVEHMKELFSETISRCHLMGRVLVSSEGVNGTLAGSEIGVRAFTTRMGALKSFSHVDWKYSFGTGEQLPFRDVHLKIVNHIISAGAEADAVIQQSAYFDDSCFGGLGGVGEHLNATQFHEALSSEDKPKIILDIRNNYEYNIGHFKNAISLNTKTYADTWKGLESVLLNESDKEQDIYMYCTGGVRCEKASAYLKAKGYANVYQVCGNENLIFFAS